MNPTTSQPDDESRNFFVVQRDSSKPIARIENFRRTVAGRSIATFDAKIYLSGSHAVTVRKMRLIDGDHGLFVAAPSFQGPTGDWVSTLLFGRETEAAIFREAELALEEVEREN